jgi:murein DD-endopeptidase MepM/ murein hydrolase activator NlpD
LHYATIFVAAAAIGMFTITGLAGSYTRMLVKTARFNQLRHDHQSLQNDYATLEKQAHQKDIQAASLGSLATEISALYGLTANKIGTQFGTLRAGGVHAAHVQPKTSVVVAAAATAPLKDAESATSSLNNDSYFRSIDALYALRSSAMDGDMARMLTPPPSLGRMENPLLPGHDLAGLGTGLNLGLASNETPTLWPVNGPITSSFGERQDVFGGDEGEFHPGIDISAPLGTPIHATADGVVTVAQMVNGYGREVTIDHGHGVATLYGHMSGLAVTSGQSVTRGEIIGYVGHSGRTSGVTGNHVHYEVRIHNTPVNPHKYLRTTLGDFSTPTASGPGL